MISTHTYHAFYLQVTKIIILSNDRDPDTTSIILIKIFVFTINK